MYTANTMASAIEALGMSVPLSSSIPAWDPAADGGAGDVAPLWVGSPLDAHRPDRAALARHLSQNELLIPIRCTALLCGALLVYTRSAALHVVRGPC